jgi:hypothetical protein
MKKTKTERGFSRIEFVDRYGEVCSLQKSSLATEHAIWFGVDHVEPKIMAVDAIRLGIPTNGQTSGWITLPVPNEVLLSARMHLTQDQIKELLPHLQKFAETGEI